MAKLGSRASFHGTVVENITAAKTLDPSDSGKVFTIDSSSSAFSITLPTAANAGAGWNCRFILTTNGSIVTIQPPSTEDTLIGIIVSTDSAAGESSESGVDELKFLAAGAAGDWAELICDGSNFYVSGQEHDNNHMTIS